MPRKISDVQVLNQYLRGVIERAEHHAGRIDEVILAVAGALVWRKDPDELEVFEREGEMKNVLWARINGERYACSYDHDTESIEIRRGSTQGAVLESFDNSSPLSDVKQFFKQL